MRTGPLKRDDFLDLAACHRQSQAESLKTVLESAGLEVRLRDERKLQRFWFLAPQKAGIHVQVRRKCYEKAASALEQHDHGKKKAVHCPSCGSTHVQYPALTRKNILPAFIGLALVVLRVQKHKYYCEDCHYTWPQPKADTRPTAILE